MFNNLIAKILYWRSKALNSLGENEYAWNDIQDAYSLQSNDKVYISNFLILFLKLNTYYI